MIRFIHTTMGMLGGGWTRKMPQVAAGAVALAAITAAPMPAHAGTHVDVQVRIGTPRPAPVAREWVPAVYEQRPVQVWVEPTYQTVANRVWVEPVYRTLGERVWREPVVRQETEQVWVPDRWEDRVVVRHVRWWRSEVRERVLVQPAHYELRTRDVEVVPGHWDTIDYQELLTPGHWDTAQTQVLLTPGHYEWRTQSVEVRPAHWEEHPVWVQRWHRW
jgi:hypothetical protein